MSKGIKLDGHLAVGDIVTVRIKPAKPVVASPGNVALAAMIDRPDPADNAQHYRMNGIFEIIELNGGNAVVKQRYPEGERRAEVWPIARHEWFEASEMLKQVEASQ